MIKDPNNCEDSTAVAAAKQISISTRPWERGEGYFHTIIMFGGFYAEGLARSPFRSEAFAFENLAEQLLREASRGWSF